MGAGSAEGRRGGSTAGKPLILGGLSIEARVVVDNPTFRRRPLVGGLFAVPIYGGASDIPRRQIVGHCAASELVRSTRSGAGAAWARIESLN